jgi:hypothetical protein
VSFAVILQLKLCLKYFIRNIHGYPWIWISIAGFCLGAFSVLYCRCSFYFLKLFYFYFGFMMEICLEFYEEDFVDLMVGYAKTKTKKIWTIFESRKIPDFCRSPYVPPLAFLVPHQIRIKSNTQNHPKITKIADNDEISKRNIIFLSKESKKNPQFTFPGRINLSCHRKV